ncbi:hypothetical protein HPB49_010660 [Dermacentor silvarum]|uniref:Uncharacterized protein n=1 Tax=Dermacentor silvarum TaxID=543639 RepID=A0ACB8DZD3_DERSI|nr:hypothetical protein HPB49_010660 [Dermacentor silvarum]
MRIILQNCESLGTVVLHSAGTLLPNDIRALETLKCLKVFSISRYIRIEDHVLQQVCASCPMIERLELSSEFIRHASTWESLQALKQLTCLSLTRISTSGLLNMSMACPSLQSLKISSVQNDNNVTVAQALETFHKLRILSVDGDCGTRWFDFRFRLPPELERFDVQQLQMDEQLIGHLVKRCGEKLRHVTISARTLTQNALNMLHDCKKLEGITVCGVCSDDMMLKLVYTLPKLVRVEINFPGEATDAVSQMKTLVDIRDKSGRGHTRLVLTAHFRSYAAGLDMIRAVHNLKEFLVLNTCFSDNEVRDLEGQCSWMSGWKTAWVPTGSRKLYTVQTCIPLISKTLKYLVVNVYEE